MGQAIIKYKLCSDLGGDEYQVHRGGNKEKDSKQQPYRAETVISMVDSDSQPIVKYTVMTSNIHRNILQALCPALLTGIKAMFSSPRCKSCGSDFCETPLRARIHCNNNAVEFRR
jgi:hypothetical protein